MTDKAKKLYELLEDETVAEEIAGDSIEEVLANLKAKGLDFTEAELMEIAQPAMATGADGEIDVEALDNVVGGGKIWNWIKKYVFNNGKTSGLGTGGSVTGKWKK